MRNSFNLDLPVLVSDSDNCHLLRPVEDHEIKDALFQMDKHKAPGPDGFGAAFYQDHWPLIQKDVCHACLLYTSPSPRD